KTYGPDEAGLYKKDPVYDLINKASEKNIFFNDDRFSPSIWKDGKTGVKQYGRIKELIKRPAMHILDTENFGLFSMSQSNSTDINPEVERSPSITDMNQKGLGNCGFVATMGSLAIHPEAHNLLFSAIYPAVYNPLGIYSVRLIFDSEIRYMLIDDQIPNEGYSSMENKYEFWYLLIEKAFAKLKGGYHNLAGGMETHIGMSSTSNININPNNKNCVWKDYFWDIFQNKHSTTYQGTGGSPKYLVGGHAYSVIDAAEWSNFKLVRLHNPWNVANYKGPFSPGSADWNKIPQDVQKNLFQVDRFKKLSFWMPYDLYVDDLPKISNIYLNEKIPDCLKEIANANSIQE
ncbi:MAG: C2 family cysteine protease, partial [Rickettsia endosymbiont of Ixodes persulcatus]|nr:C2 family cysteine protease [Rickettsia endosymbiont of Ixodes persulcatus]